MGVRLGGNAQLRFTNGIQIIAQDAVGALFSSYSYGAVVTDTANPIFTGATIQAGNAKNHSYGLWAGSTAWNTTNQNNTIQAGDGDADNDGTGNSYGLWALAGTATLDGGSITSGAGNSVHTYGVRLHGTAQLQFTNGIQITAQAAVGEPFSDSYGAYITGSANPTFTGAIIQAGNANDHSYGLRTDSTAWNTTNQNNTIRAGDGDADNDGTGNSYGLWASAGTAVLDGGSITSGTGNSVNTYGARLEGTAQLQFTNGIQITAQNAVGAIGSDSYGASVTGNANPTFTNATIQAGNANDDSFGIWSDSAGWNTLNTNVTVQAGTADLDDNGFGASYGMWIVDGSPTISSSSIAGGNVVAGAVDGASSYGLYVDNAANPVLQNVSISAGNADAGSFALYVASTATWSTTNTQLTLTAGISNQLTTHPVGSEVVSIHGSGVGLTFQNVNVGAPNDASGNGNMTIYITGGSVTFDTGTVALSAGVNCSALVFTGGLVAFRNMTVGGSCFGLWAAIHDQRPAGSGDVDFTGTSVAGNGLVDDTAATGDIGDNDGGVTDGDIDGPFVDGVNNYVNIQNAGNSISGIDTGTW